jgi:hypothetical protein
MSLQQKFGLFLNTLCTSTLNSPYQTRKIQQLANFLFENDCEDINKVCTSDVKLPDSIY